MSRFILGLTGGMASGKSTVAGWLEEAGFLVVDADEVVAELYAPGGKGALAVAEMFGAEALNDEGGVDHPKLAAIVFSDPAARKRLEAAIHPLVREHFGQIAQAATGVIVYEATLLTEAGQTDGFDLVLTIEAPEERRLAWAIGRGMDEKAARARLTAQGDGAFRRSQADRILNNDGTLDDLRTKVQTLIEELRGHLTNPRARQTNPAENS